MPPASAPPVRFERGGRPAGGGTFDPVVRRFEELVHIGRGGEEHDLFLRRGLPCPNPERGARCPRCGDLRVHLADERVRSV
jgi:hypothetical protein